MFYRYGYKIERYAHADGVFKSEIAGIAEDKYGYLWFSNVDYLLRYDGYDFTRYKLPRSLLSELGSSNYFHSITPQNDGRLFLTTFGYGRLLIFDPQTKIFTQPSPDGENGGKEFQTYTSYNFLRDNKGKYWTGTMAGLVHFDLEGVRVIADTFLSNDANSTPFFGQDSILYCATDSSLYRIFDQQGEIQFQRISTNSVSPYPESIAPASSGGVWLGGAKGAEAGPGQQLSGLYKYDTQENTFIEIQLGITLESRIKTILETPDGNLWIGTYGTGLYRLSPPFVPVGDTINSPHIQYIDLRTTSTSEVHHGYIWDLALDRQNNLWVGTRQQFLHKVALRDNTIKYVNLRSSANLPQKTLLRKLFVDSQGNSWITAHGHGIILVDKAQNIQHFKRDFYGVNIENTSLYPLCEQEEIIWFGGERKLIAYHKEDAQARIWPLPYDLKDGEYIIRMFPITTTKMILLTRINRTMDYRNYHLDIDTRQMVRSSPPNSSYVDITSHLETDREEGFWVMEGLGYRSIHHLKYEDGRFDTLVTKTVSTLCTGFAQDTAGNLWVASGLGFYHLDMQLNSLRRYDEENGLIDSFVKDVEVGPDGNIWLQSGYGFFRFDPTMEQFLVVDALTNHQPSQEVTLASIAIREEGQVHLLDKDGVFIFHPDDLKEDTLPPKLVLEKIIVADSLILCETTKPGYLKFPHYKNDITIDYVGINFNQASENKYHYILEPFQQEWQDVGKQRSARFSNLPPGTYTFSVKAANMDNYWSSPLEFSFTILPPWYWAWWSKLLYVLLAGGSIYSFYRFQLEKRLTEQESVRLRELDKVKNRLYTNITHEFRTPLTVIQGMAQQINGKYQKETRLIRKNSRNLLHLVNQMLDLSKLESGKLHLQMVQGDVIGFLRHEIDTFKTFATSGNVALHFESRQQDLLMDFDVQKLRQVMVNLLSNAIKFINGEGKVTVAAHHIQDQLKITVTDNGIGIPADRLPYIFDRFYQVDDKATRAHEGTGIGLALTNELVELMQGQITVASTEGEGTRFTILLPVHNQAPQVEFEREPEALEMVASTGAVSVASDRALTDPSLATALIIEDNEDIIQYLTYCLQDDYQVLTALNGEEGIKTAIAHTPDVIICDVMMPKADGFEVTATLKEDERTSHIPIIILTAKVDQSSKVTGLDSGADAYLTKPFDREELMVRLEKLVALRKTLQAKYASPDYFSPDKVTIDPKEDIFIQKLKHQIEAHLEETEFGIEQLANAMTLSRSQLYRKTKALTGQSIAVFVRTVRLHHGKKLLGETSLSVSEVAYRVGFSDPAYFSKTYSKLFGYPPGQERE